MDTSSPVERLTVACNKMRAELEKQGALWLAVSELLGQDGDDYETIFTEYGRHGLKVLLQTLSERAYNAAQLDATTEQLLK